MPFVSTLIYADNAKNLAFMLSFAMLPTEVFFSKRVYSLSATMLLYVFDAIVIKSFKE